MTIEPRFAEVRCLSPAGFHVLRYTEWGRADNPAVVVCVHGLTRTGRDFDRLAHSLADRFRVVCPDVVGRGRSEWLRDPAYYGVPQYAADLVTLIARLDVPRVAWVGTSMGGLIGMTLAGQPGSPIGRMVINDVGPRLEPAAIARIGDYVGRPVSFERFDDLVDYVASISAGFGLTRREDWVEATRHVARRDGERWILHYDPRIGQPLRSASPEAAAAGEAILWSLYDRIAAPVLLLRGAQSDLLSAATAAEMAQRGPRARVVEIAGVGHAPMFFDALQIGIVREFLLEPGTDPASA